MSDMTVDVFAAQPFGILALSKMSGISANFRLYEAGWLGNGKQRDVMKVTGAEFRAAKSGKNKGKLSIVIVGTKQTVFVTAMEMEIQHERI